MKICLKAEQLFMYKGSYSVISNNEDVAECELYNVKIHHTLERPAFEKLEVRKCPFQPEPLFLLSGNTRVPVFTLTWSGNETTDLHIDYYLDV